ncbi:MAG: hypothetical protein CSA39_04575 [Flavobacteriales bacterium]|nr:MAG: hypothetical protein CSA39_04575 [Flavobacteriales bacterium]
MNFIKKIFSTATTENDKESGHDSSQKETITLTTQPLDEYFVSQFIKNGGKFLYCTHQEEVNQHLMDIFEENNWKKAVCFNPDLEKRMNMLGLDSTETISKNYPFFTLCENLLADTGSIMFSSNQVHDKKIAQLPDNFVVFASTSQLVRDAREAFMSIKQNYNKDYPSNISSIKCYEPEKVEDDFLSYGNKNAKKLFLLLLEDL